MITTICFILGGITRSRLSEKIVKKSDNISVMTSSFILDSGLDNQATIQDVRKQKEENYSRVSHEVRE